MIRFIPQSTLDGWMDSGKVDVLPDRLVDAATRREFPMREAVHLIKVESGVDSQGWSCKVKSVEEVRSIGGEHYMTSVILGETVYVVDPGWMAEDGEGATRPPAKKGEGKNPEADALAQLLLDKLS